MTSSESRSICIIGAGFSGLCASIQLKKAFPNYSITIFDSNSDFGGTWQINTYPGCACDIPSHLYSLSFEPNPYWSSHYASQLEILMYIKRLATKHDLYSNARFWHRVNELKWDGVRNKWIATVVNLQDNLEENVVFDYVFCGTGEFHLPNIPEIFSNFKGESMHSAEWNHDINLTGKIVGVVGSGASALQIIPNIVDRVGKLLSYQRTPAWIVSRSQFNYPKCVQWLFSNVPGLAGLYRKCIYLAYEAQYPAFRVNDGVVAWFANPIGRLMATVHLRRQVNRPQLRSTLTPNYKFGCNRVCLSSHFYPALCKSNVEVIRDKIVDVTSKSIKTSDREDQIDVLILATGFKIHEYFGPMRILGRNGEDILKTWKERGPSLYLELMSASMPNLFVIHGPGVDLGHNTGLVTIELQVKWIIKLLKYMERTHHSVVTVNDSEEKNYVERHRHDMNKTIWSTNECVGKTCYADYNGLITIVYPRSQVDYWWRTRAVSFEHFEFS